MFTYQKGGSVIRMMEQILGAATLTKGLQYYLAALSYKGATEDDLFFHLEVLVFLSFFPPTIPPGGGTRRQRLAAARRSQGFPVRDPQAVDKPGEPSEQ